MLLQRLKTVYRASQLRGMPVSRWYYVREYLERLYFRISKTSCSLNPCEELAIATARMTYTERNDETSDVETHAYSCYFCEKHLAEYMDMRLIPYNVNERKYS